MSLKIASIFLVALAISSPQHNIDQLDKQIEALENQKERYQMQVEQNINNAMRWQFQNESYLEARRAWQQAAATKQKIQEKPKLIENDALLDHFSATVRM